MTHSPILDCLLEGNCKDITPEALVAYVAEVREKSAEEARKAMATNHLAVLEDIFADPDPHGAIAGMIYALRDYVALEAITPSNPTK